MIGEKKTFPLYLRFLRDTIDNRKVFIGDSAQSIHPLAGQGLNLGLRDVACLFDILLEGKKLGLDIGSVKVTVLIETINAVFQMDNDYLTWWLYMFGSFNHRMYIARAKLLVQSCSCKVWC